MGAILLALQAVPRTVLYWAIVALVVLLAGSSVQVHVVKGQRDEARLTLAQRTAEWAQQREVMASQARQASEQARAIEQQRAADLASAQEKHDAEVQQYQADAARGADALGRLRSALAAATATRRRPAAGGASAPAVSAPTDQVAEFFGQCAARYRELGEAADAARAAGLQCQRSYEALITPHPALPGSDR